MHSLGYEQQNQESQNYGFLKGGISINYYVITEHWKNYAAVLV